MTPLEFLEAVERRAKEIQDDPLYKPLDRRLARKRASLRTDISEAMIIAHLINDAAWSWLGIGADD